ncbi:dihydroorotate dehydrogenase [Brevibacillus migulae]|uniref:dihydroorotate dehydrogenase n=1 Tax=Brevibacillus migulae TaxID=1644114 RepID=UPI00106EE2CF|nr:dihydroorotate dehydrogenase [Brevibacillus migulae]
MPDWSYHPLFRPLLFSLSAEKGRDLALTAMGTLASLPFGPAVIELLGHMEPPEQLKTSYFGISFDSPVGLGAGLDVHARALPALAKFGFGYLEAGPVTVLPVKTEQPIQRITGTADIFYPDPPPNDGAAAWVNRLQRIGTLPVPLAMRIGCSIASSPAKAAYELLTLMELLEPYCSFFTVEIPRQIQSQEWSLTEWRELLSIVKEQKRGDLPLLLCIPPNIREDVATQLLEPALETGFAGVLIGGGIEAADHAARIVGGSTFPQSLELVRHIRKWAGESLPIIASGGIQEPADALLMLDAGASLIQLHSGLIYSGPGLPKRVNEAIAFYQAQDAAILPHSQKENRSIPSWVWAAILGAGMIISGIIAWLVAATSVVLPYDLSFLRMDATELDALNPLLLPFMSHDRISLAGTMISIGVIYLQFAIFPLRRGIAWARHIYIASNTVGFVSFFLFIGYGYFDWLHAFLALLLFPFFLLSLRGLHSVAGQPSLPPNLVNDSQWKRGLWGQLCFVIIGCGLLGAGLIISLIGVTHVFVPSDLAFLGAHAHQLHGENERLIPLIAHDRAGFGGALVSDGIAVLLLSLWGFRQGERWIWWTLLTAGFPGFLAGIGVHVSVGYLDFWHLFPAYVAFLLFLVGLWLCYPYLCKQAPLVSNAK